MLHELVNIVLYNIFSIYCSNRAVAHAVCLTSRHRHSGTTAHYSPATFKPLTSMVPL